LNIITILAAEFIWTGYIAEPKQTRDLDGLTIMSGCAHIACSKAKASKTVGRALISILSMAVILMKAHMHAVLQHKLLIVCLILVATV
jgi:hypothetical protein